MAENNDIKMDFLKKINAAIVKKEEAREEISERLFFRLEDDFLSWYATETSTEANDRIALPGNWCIKDEGDGLTFLIEPVNEGGETLHLRAEDKDIKKDFLKKCNAATEKKGWMLTLIDKKEEAREEISEKRFFRLEGDFLSCYATENATEAKDLVGLLGNWCVENNRIALPGNWCVKDCDGDTFSIEAVKEEGGALHLKADSRDDKDNFFETISGAITLKFDMEFNDGSTPPKNYVSAARLTRCATVGDAIVMG
jgi:hypothetical protein